jgi:hypothetical protein
MIKTSGRAALVVLAGLFLLFAAAAQAAPASAAKSEAKSEAKSDGASKQVDETKPAKHRRQAHSRSDSKTADKSSDDKPDASKDGAKDTAAAQAKSDDAPPSSQMPPQVADANAQAATTDTPTAAAASAMTNRASDNVQAAADNSAGSGAENQVVAPDQLNDVDRTLQQDTPAAPPAVIAATDPQPRPAPVMAASQQTSAWDQSSLIGKIFIGFGALLTLASAARMFMA